MSSANKYNIGGVKSAACQMYDIEPSQLIGKRRHRKIAWPRQMAMAVARDITHRSMPEIGRSFGDRDHTTVIHALRQVKKRRLESPRIEIEYTELRRMALNAIKPIFLRQKDKITFKSRRGEA